MENHWAPHEESWRQKLRNGETIDFTKDTKDAAVFKKMGSERVERYKIMKNLAPLPHQGDFDRCEVVALLGHIRDPGHDLSKFTEDEKNLYFANLLQRPIVEGEPIRGLSMSLGTGWWSEHFEPVLTALQEDRGMSSEEAWRALKEKVAMVQVHPYTCEEDGDEYEPAALKKTMEYSLQLARKAIERGAIALVLLRWSHWAKAKVLGLSQDSTPHLLRTKRQYFGCPDVKRSEMLEEESNVTYDDLLNALCGQELVKRGTPEKRLLNSCIAPSNQKRKAMEASVKPLRKKRRSLKAMSEQQEQTTSSGRGSEQDQAKVARKEVAVEQLDARSPSLGSSPAVGPMREGTRSETILRRAGKARKQQASNASVPNQEHPEAAHVKEKAQNGCAVRNVETGVDIAALQAANAALRAELEAARRSHIEAQKSHEEMLRKEWDQKSTELLAELAKVTKENQDLSKHVEAQGGQAECQGCFEVWSDATQRGMFNGCAHVNYCTVCATEYINGRGTSQEAGQPPTYRCPVGCVLDNNRVLAIAGSF